MEIQQIIMLCLAFAFGGMAGVGLMLIRGQRLRESLILARQQAEQAESLRGELAAARDEERQTGEALAAAQQRIRDMQEHHEQAKEGILKGVTEVSQKISSKLLEDNQRLLKEGREEQQKITQQRTEQLMENMKQVSEKLASIANRTDGTEQRMELVMRSLSNPSGAGKMAEVGLENLLKNLGLHPGQDFDVQYALRDEGGQSLRPDAVIYLPQDAVMVIDCKASRFFIELAQAQGDQEHVVLAQLLKTMHLHIDRLAQKQYADAVRDWLKEKKRRMGTMFNIMYVPSEAAFERLRAADATLVTKLERSAIVLVSPSSLHGVCMLAKLEINGGRQAENQQKIIDTISALMESVITSVEHVGTVGARLKSSMESLDKFTAAINRNVIPKLRKLQDLGVAPTKNKALPRPLERFEVHNREVITLEAENVELSLIEDKKEAI